VTCIASFFPIVNSPTVERDHELVVHDVLSRALCVDCALRGKKH
jgi:hypothetical protein